jgi:hypothetical protein
MLSHLTPLVYISARRSQVNNLLGFISRSFSSSCVAASTCSMWEVINKYIYIQMPCLLAQSIESIALMSIHACIVMHYFSNQQGYAQSERMQVLILDRFSVWHCLKIQTLLCNQQLAAFQSIATPWVRVCVQCQR